MRDDEGPIVGRDEELAALEQELAAGESGLLLLVGVPRIGKARMLRELRAMAVGRDYPVVPADTGASDRPFLVIDRHCTIRKFEDDLPAATDGDGHDGRDGALHVVLVYGYRPDDDFAAWFTGTFLRSLPDRRPPLLIAVAGMVSDVHSLESHARRRIVLARLPRDAVVAELCAVSARIAEPLQGAEVDRYADAVVADPALLDAFRELLPLTAPEAPPVPAPAGG
jgi:hypothetical protein